jgi:glycosidase
MKKRILICLLLGITLLFSACNEEELLQNPAEIVIKVVDEAGEVVANADVNLEGVATAKTDSQGLVAFDDIRQAKLKAIISKSGYDSKEKKLNLTSLSTKLTVELIRTKLDKEDMVIVDANQYIDIDDNMLKFLFKTNPANRINLYLGESSDKLEKVKSNVNYNNQGIKMEGLTPNKTYYYKIEAINGENTISTKVLSFKKMGNTNNWAPAKWARESIFYEVFVRSFYDGNGDQIGDFVGLKEKIPYLKELGVDALWLMPINDSPSYHGYDVVDYYNTNPDYGTLEEFQEFLQAAHDNGIKVIMDLVVNHTSSRNPWFESSAYEEGSQYRDYYVWQDEFDDINEAGPWGQRVWYQRSNKEYYHAVFWSEMPDLNFSNPEVRAEMKKVARFWLDPDNDGDFSDGVDGFRLDAAKHIDDKDGDVTHNWWQEFNTAVKEVNPNAFLVGENWAETDKMARFFEDLDASFNFSLADRMIEVTNGENIDIIKELKEIHAKYSSYSDNFIDATFLRNHDQNRVASELGSDKEKMKLAASLLLTLPGTPFIYYGEEIGQIGTKPDDNIREPFDWYSDAAGNGMTTMDKGGFYHPMAYTKADDGISLEEQQGIEESIFEHYKRLIRVRKSNPAFFSSTNYTKLDISGPNYIYKVESPQHVYDFFVIHNLSNSLQEIAINADAYEMLTATNYNASDILKIPAYGTMILKSTATERELFNVRKVVFSYKVDPSVDKVLLLGDMTSWNSADGLEMKDRDNDGIYEVELKLTPGQYKYQFVTETHTLDPDAPLSSDGKKNQIQITKSDSKETMDYTFSFDLPENVNEGDRVTVAGEFNGWNPQATDMTDRDGDGVYEATLSLSPGEYQYKFVINGGERWISDPKATKYSNDGNRNSIVTVGGHIFSYNPDKNINGVMLIGDMNDWEPFNTILRENTKTGAYESSLWLKPGQYQYQFIELKTEIDPNAEEIDGVNIITVE